MADRLGGPAALLLAAWMTMGAAVAAAPPALAQAAETRFDIPAQPLAGAVTDFGQQSGLQVAVDSTILAGLRSRAVSGTLTAEEALARMLEGTGVLWRFTDARTVTLERPSSAEGEPAVLTLDPVTVTGERVTRPLSETAASVLVFDAEDLRDRPRIDTVKDAMADTPNVTVTGETNIAPAVRGIDGTGPTLGSYAFFAGVRPRLNVQVDGRPLSYNELVFGDVDLWDVDRVEVFRGPQSTLQGRNAIAGTVVVRTNDPTYVPEAGARLVGGMYDTRRASAVVNGPVVPGEIALRLSADYETSRSFVHMDSYPAVSDPGKYESLDLRGKLLVEPSALPGLSALVTLAHSADTGPQVELVGRPYDDHVTSVDAMPVFSPQSSSAIVETTWELSDSLAAEGTFSFTDIKVKRKTAPGDGNINIDGTELLLEPRLRFSGIGGRVDGVAGLYFFDARQDEFIDFGLSDYDDKTTTLAVFGEGTVALADGALDLILGARYEQERRRRVGGAAPIFDVDLDETYRAFLPKLGLAWHATDRVTLGAVVSRGYNGGGAGVTFNEPFVSYTYEPEYVWTYEAFARARLLDDTLDLTGNVFFSDYRDIQLPFLLGEFSSVIRNAKRAITYGAEIGARWLPLPGLEVYGNFGLLKTDITDFEGSGIEGNDLPRAPAFTADLGAVYRHENGLEASVAARISDAYYSDVDNDPRGKIDPYVVVDAQVGYNFSTGFGDGRVYAFVDNLFDQTNPVIIYYGATEGEDTAVLQRPRTVGVGLEMRF